MRCLDKAADPDDCFFCLRLQCAAQCHNIVEAQRGSVLIARLYHAPMSFSSFASSSFFSFLLRRSLLLNKETPSYTPSPCLPAQHQPKAEALVRELHLINTTRRHKSFATRLISS